MRIGVEATGDYSGNYGWDTPLSPEERQKQIREFASRFRVLSIVTFVMAVISVVFGAVKIYLGYPLAPYVIPVAIIVGILMIIGSIFGFKASKLALVEGEEKKTRCFVVVLFVMSTISIIFCLFSVMVAAWGMILCVVRLNDCGAALIVVELVCIVSGLLLFTYGITGAIFFCCYGRALGFKSREEQTFKWHMKRLQIQQKIDGNRESNTASIS